MHRKLVRVRERAHHAGPERRGIERGVKVVGDMRLKRPLDPVLDPVTDERQGLLVEPHALAEAQRELDRQDRE